MRPGCEHGESPSGGEYLVSPPLLQDESAGKRTVTQARNWQVNARSGIVGDDLHNGLDMMNE
jgi:hypothetical protein